jgi:hypothetical protein
MGNLERSGATVEAAETTIAWVEKLIVNLNLGIETLAVGKLPPQLFPPGRLERVLKEIILLPQGWMLNTASKEDQVWAIYRDARVTSALVEGKLRVFAEIPVTYQGNQFYSPRIIAMPVYSPSNQKGIVVENLPTVLAVTADRQTFVELKEDDAALVRLRAFPE